MAAGKKRKVDKPSTALVTVGAIQRTILVVRDRQVMLDTDLAELYGVETKALTRAVRRNRERFPKDFMFQLTKDEWDDLRSQIGTSNTGSGGRRYRPYVFSEQGVAMLSSVLRSKEAAAVNIEIMRAFVGLRRLSQSHEKLENRIAQLEKDLSKRLGKSEAEIAAIIKLLTETTMSKKRKHQRPHPRAGRLTPRIIR